MSDVTNALTSKIGPLPGYAWAGMLVGGAWIAHWYTKRNSVSNTGSVQAPLSTDPSTPLDTGYNPGSTLAASNIATPQGSPANTTNAQFARSVTDGLIAGGADPTLTTNAISKWLSGSTLSSAEQSIVNQAITHYGSPPEGIVAIQTAPAANGNKYVSFEKDTSNNALYGVTSDGSKVKISYPQYLAAGGNASNTHNYQSLTGFDWNTQGGALVAMLNHSGGSAPAPAPVPASHPAASSGSRTYRVVSGDSLSAIAQRYYGNYNDWQKIYDANRGAIGGNPNLIYPGTVLVIP